MGTRLEVDEHVPNPIRVGEGNCADPFVTDRNPGRSGVESGERRVQIAEAIEEDPLVDSAHWQSSVDDLLADLPRFQGNLSLMMSGLITE